MVGAGMTNEHSLVLDGVTAATICGALIDTVSVVDALAHSVAFDNSHAHLEGCLKRWLRFKKDKN